MIKENPYPCDAIDAEKVREGEASKYLYTVDNFKWFTEVSPIYEHNLRFVIDYIRGRKLNKEKLKVFEPGCGSGLNLTNLSHLFPHFEYYGTDISPYGIEVARKCAVGTYALGDVENIQFKDETFDIVLCSSLIHHFRNVNRMLFEIHRVLKPRGLLFIHEPGRRLPVFKWKYRFIPHVVTLCHHERTRFRLTSIAAIRCQRKINGLPGQETHDPGKHPDEVLRLWKKPGINVFAAKKYILNLFHLEEEYERDYLSFWAAYKKLGFDLAVEFDEKYLVRGTKYMGIYKKK